MNNKPNQSFLELFKLLVFSIDIVFDGYVSLFLFFHGLVGIVDVLFLQVFELWDLFFFCLLQFVHRFLLCGFSNMSIGSTTFLFNGIHLDNFVQYFKRSWIWHQLVNETFKIVIASIYVILQNGTLGLPLLSLSMLLKTVWEFLVYESFQIFIRLGRFLIGIPIISKTAKRVVHLK